MLCAGPLPFGALAGYTDWPVVSKTRVTVKNFTKSVETRRFEGKTDKEAGTIEVSEYGLYEVSGILGGQMTGFTDHSQIVLFVRPSGRADLGPVTAYSLPPSRTSFVGLSFSFLDTFNEGEQLSLQLDSPDDINQTFVISYASFQVARRTEMVE